MEASSWCAWPNGWAVPLLTAALASRALPGVAVGRHCDRSEQLSVVMMALTATYVDTVNECMYIDDVECRRDQRRSSCNCRVLSVVDTRGCVGSSWLTLVLRPNVLPLLFRTERNSDTIIDCYTNMRYRPQRCWETHTFTKSIRHYPQKAPSSELS